VPPVLDSLEILLEPDLGRASAGKRQKLAWRRVTSGLQPVTAVTTSFNALTPSDIWADVFAVRAQRPLMHSITNPVVMNYNANCLPAIQQDLPPKTAIDQRTADTDTASYPVEVLILFKG